MFVGPSGIGKTHLSKFIADKYGIPFISGSYSDMVPSTKDQSHADMVSKDSKVIYNEDYKLLWARAKVYLGYTTKGLSFVTDRSYIDSIAYFIYKLSKVIPKCEIEGFEHAAKMLLFRDCTHLIVMQCTESMVDTWRVENNEKRILNTYFQWMVSMVMIGVLKRLGLRTGKYFGHTYSYMPMGIKVLVLNNRNMENNKVLISKFLGNVK